ncbi:Uncharacterised protein [Vibrio cholerae]|nr:Uncharacterised protein [Vibrio cholerae]
MRVLLPPLSGDGAALNSHAQRGELHCLDRQRSLALQRDVGFLGISPCTPCRC